MPHYFQVHVSTESKVADHCQLYALSDPNNAFFHEDCNHDHNRACSDCRTLDEALVTIEAACAEVGNEEDREDLKYMFQQAKQDILSWKAHQLRTVHQDEAKFAVLEKLNHKSALLVVDWAMKYLPRKFRESQCDWFAKRGLPWHITVVLTRPEEGGPLEKQPLCMCSRDVHRTA